MLSLMLLSYVGLEGDSIAMLITVTVAPCVTVGLVIVVIVVAVILYMHKSTKKTSVQQGNLKATCTAWTTQLIVVHAYVASSHGSARGFSAAISKIRVCSLM